MNNVTRILTQARSIWNIGGDILDAIAQASPRQPADCITAIKLMKEACDTDDLKQWCKDNADHGGLEFAHAIAKSEAA